MCNACGFACCAYDAFVGCGCNDCDCPECWRCEVCDQVGHDMDTCNAEFEECDEAPEGML